jgi:hypothetical protein
MPFLLHRLFYFMATVFLPAVSVGNRLSNLRNRSANAVGIRFRRCDRINHVALPILAPVTNWGVTVGKVAKQSLGKSASGKIILKLPYDQRADETLREIPDAIFDLC